MPDFFRGREDRSLLATSPIPVVTFLSLSETLRYSFSITNPIELTTLDKKYFKNYIIYPQIIVFLKNF